MQDLKLEAGLEVMVNRHIEFLSEVETSEVFNRLTPHGSHLLNISRLIGRMDLVWDLIFARDRVRIRIWCKNTESKIDRENTDIPTPPSLLNLKIRSTPSH